MIWPMIGQKFDYKPFLFLIFDPQKEDYIPADDFAGWYDYFPVSVSHELRYGIWLSDMTVKGPADCLSECQMSMYGGHKWA